MFYSVDTPINLYGFALDEYLKKGWYRMGQTIFTTGYVEHAGDFFPVHWIRYNLKKFHRTKKQEQIAKRNQGFTTHVAPLMLTATLENLYTKYRNYIRFDAAPSVKDNLMSMSINDDYINIYDSWLMELRHDNLLIAAGVFDKGLESFAGIKTFYDPDYAKYSPGKYLLLCKIEYAIAEGAAYFYPGYIAEVYTKFHYKMEAAPTALEIYNPQKNSWHPFLMQDFIDWYEGKNGE